MYTKILTDLDGTVYLGGAIIDSVDTEIRRLSAEGVEFFYMTNNTSLSTEDYVRKLTDLELPVSCNNIISPIRALKKFLLERGLSRVYVVGTSSFIKELCDSSNINSDLTGPDIVIVGFDRELSYDKLEVACRFINRGVPYYLTHIDLACPSPSGPIPDCGAIGALLEAATGVKSSGHFGKPGEELIKYIRSITDENDKILVAGDRIYTDVALGLALGSNTLLVRTGEVKLTTEELDGKIFVADTFGAYLRQMKSM